MAEFCAQCRPSKFVATDISSEATRRLQESCSPSATTNTRPTNRPLSLHGAFNANNLTPTLAANALPSAI